MSEFTFYCPFESRFMSKNILDVQTSKYNEVKFKKTSFDVIY